MTELNAEYVCNINIAGEMKEQLVQLLLQLAGILWPRGKSKSFTICFYFWSCLSIGWLTSATCSSFVYKMFFTCTNLPPSFLSLYFSLSFLPPSLSSFFPLLILGDWRDGFRYIFATHDTFGRNQNRIHLPLLLDTYLYRSSNMY